MKLYGKHCLVTMIFALGLNGCGGSGGEVSSSTLSSVVGCGVVDGAQCEATTRGAASVKIFTYTPDSLASKHIAGTGFENGALYVYAPTIEIARIPVKRLGAVNIRMPVEFSEIQTRHQEWKKCGRLGIERCRKWVDDGRTPIDASVEIWVGPDRGEPVTYSTQILGPGEWNEDWNVITTVLGPFQAIGEGDPFGFASSMVSTILGGRELKNAWRAYTGSQTLERSFDLGNNSEPAEVTVVVRRNANKGTFVVRPFTIEVVQY